MNQITAYEKPNSSIKVPNHCCPPANCCSGCEHVVKVELEGDETGLRCGRPNKTKTIAYKAWLKEEAARVENIGMVSRIVVETNADGISTGRVALFAGMPDEEED